MSLTMFGVERRLLRFAALVALLVALMALSPARNVSAADAPTITGVSPSTGPASGGTVLTITGTGFATGATVTIGGVPALNVTRLDSTRILATTPPGSPGLPTITVTNLDGQSGTINNAFRYLDLPPSITTITPNSGPSTGGTAVTITGLNFQTGASVSLGGTAATSVSVQSSTVITATTAPHAIGTVDLVVTNPDAQAATLASAYAYLPAAAPSVTGVEPGSGPTTGGTTVAITGSGFVAGATVTFDGVPAASVSVVSTSRITAKTPAHAAGLVPVAVRNPDSQTGTLVAAYAYVVGPTVTLVSPNSGPTTGGTFVTISGSGFASGATVAFGGLSASNVTVVSTTKITALTPAITVAGPVTVTVTNPGGIAGNLTGGFTYTSSIGIASLSPSSGPASGGTAVLVSGQGFVTGMTVTFGGVSAPTVVLISPSQLFVTTPPHVAGTVDVVLTAPSGERATRRDAYRYEGIFVSSITPDRGSTAGGTDVTIRGSGFARGAIVLFDGLVASDVRYVNQAELRATTPAHPAGRADVQVYNPTGATAFIQDGFLYAASTPTIRRISPNSGPSVGGTSVVIEGTGFEAGLTVEFGTLAGRSVTVVNPNLLVVVTPPHAPGSASVTIRNRDGGFVRVSAGFTFLGTSGILSGTIPPSGLALVLFSGGTNDQLVAAAAPSCPVPRVAFFATRAGKWLTFIPGAPANVNAEWNAVFVSGIPSNTTLLVRCR